MTRPSKANKAERTRLAFEYRKSGMSLRDIAAQLGVSHETVRKDIYEITESYINESRTLHSHMLMIEMSRLDDMISGIWPLAKSGDTKAIESVLKIMERRAKMLGSDAVAPTKQLQIHVTPEELAEMSDDELQQLVQKLR